MPTIWRFLASVFLILCVTGGPAAAQTVDDRLDRLEEELNSIRKENRELKKRLSSVETEEEEESYSLDLLSRLVDVSGYADVEYRHTDEDNVNDGFRIRHLSLFFTKDVQPEWKVFTEMEYEDAPYIESAHSTDDAAAVQGKIFVEQMYIEYHPSYNWDIRFGRFLTPAGIWSIYHYYPYVPTQERPLMVRNVFPQVSDGAQLRFSLPVLGSMLDTHVYVANGAGSPGKLDRNEHKAVGLRLNYSPNIFHGLSFGLSYFRDKDPDKVVRNSFGAHLQLNWYDFKLQSEYAFRNNNPEDVPGDYNDKGLYAQLSYDIGKWTLAGRWDWYDPRDTDPASDRFRYTGAINYHFAHNVVGKAEYNRNEFDDPATKDFNEVILSIVVAIGDL